MYRFSPFLFCVSLHLFKSSLCGGIQTRIIAFRQSVTLVHDQDSVYISAAVFLLQVAHCHQNGLGDGVIALYPKP